ncbi:MAG: DUF368 domain-containing protein [Oscillospiraceae bacterium]
MKKFLEYIKAFLSGLAFGIANVIPGVSGGTMLVIFGVFDRLMESISGIKAIFKNILFLLSFGLGAGSGIIMSAFVISSLFESFGIQTNMFFIGLILGSVPLIVKIGTEEQKARPACIIPFVIALAAVVGLSVLEQMDVFQIAPDVVEGFDIIASVKLVVCAAIAALTMIIPGVSGSFVMMLLGVYETIINAIKTLNLFVIIPFAIGAVIGIIGGAKLISTFIKKKKLMTYSAVLGLVIGSVYAIIPAGFGFNLSTGYGFVCLLFGILAAVLIDKLGSLGGDNSAK